MIQTFSDTNDLLTFNGQEGKKGAEIGGYQQLAEEKLVTQPAKQLEMDTSFMRTNRGQDTNTTC